MYSTSLHGSSMGTWWRKLEEIQGGLNRGCSTILVVQDTNLDVFGGFSSADWRRKPHFYGSGESFLWRFPPGSAYGEVEAVGDGGTVDKYNWCDKPTFIDWFGAETGVLRHLILVVHTVGLVRTRTFNFRTDRQLQWAALQTSLSRPCIVTACGWTVDYTSDARTVARPVSNAVPLRWYSRSLVRGRVDTHGGATCLMLCCRQQRSVVRSSSYFAGRALRRPSN